MSPKSTQPTDLGVNSLNRLANRVSAELVLLTKIKSRHMCMRYGQVSGSYGVLLVFSTVTMELFGFKRTVWIV